MHYFRLIQYLLIILLAVLLITGCKKDDSPTSPAVNTITINGIVKDVDGEPIANATVIVKGKSPTLTTAAGGFSVANVAVPYDITLILSTQKTAVVYQGLTRSDPTLLYLSSTLATTRSATISGSVPPAVGKITRIFFVSGSKLWSATSNDVTGSYSLYPSWKSSTTISYTGKLYVLRYTTNPNGLPAQYDGFGSMDLTISDGGTFTGKDFQTADLTDPAEQNISGTITRPTTSYNLTTKELYLNFGYAVLYLGGESGSGLTDDFSYAVPTISGATFEVKAYANVADPNLRSCSFSKTGIAGGTSGVNITLSDAPKLNLPANNGTGIDTTTQFLWAPGGGTGVSLTFIAPNGGNYPIFYIFSNANSTFIPNLNPQGLGLPSNKSYGWYVIKWYPLSSIDNLVADSFLPWINGHGGDLGRESSEVFNFTTKP